MNDVNKNGSHVSHCCAIYIGRNFFSFFFKASEMDSCRKTQALRISDVYRDMPYGTAPPYVFMSFMVEPCQIGCPSVVSFCLRR